MTATLLYRIAAVVLLLFAAGHTFGFLKFQPPTPEGVAVRDAMDNVQFKLGSRSYTYGDFYRGFGLFVRPTCCSLPSLPGIWAAWRETPRRRSGPWAGSSSSCNWRALYSAGNTLCRRRLSFLPCSRSLPAGRRGWRAAPGHKQPVLIQQKRAAIQGDPFAVRAKIWNR